MAPPTGFGRVTHRLRQLPRVAARAIRHPSWLVETVRGVVRRRRSARVPFRLADHTDRFVEPSTAVSHATGASVEEAGAALAAVWTPSTKASAGTRSTALDGSWPRSWRPWSRWPGQPWSWRRESPKG